MRKNQVLSSALAFALSISLSIAPALGANPQKPLRDKENPQLIGNRDINKGQINFYSLEKEVAIGRQMAADVDRYSKLLDDPIILEFVNRVTQNLVINSDIKVPVTVKVIDSSDINAFALPGRFLYVNRGLIEAADDEAELAGVIAHEAAHIAARHGVEQASKGNLISWATLPLIFLGGWGGFIINQAAGIAIPLGFLKFSRGAEKEADRLAAQYLWKTGYDPHALITFFEKLQAREKKKPGTLEKVFRSHPMTEDRIKEVQELLARFPEKGEYQISSSDFIAVKARLGTAGHQRRLIESKNERRRPTLKRRKPVNDNQTTETTPYPESGENAKHAKLL
ncbi:MAG: M48 family metalloprotease [Acidobacteria bacterium]|nr:M48 family metalloprotease [Acidobacteriota bacterium]